jgi:hypothetical protein
MAGITIDGNLNVRNGVAQFEDYGQSNITGTPATNAVFDTNGNIIEAPLVTTGPSVSLQWRYDTSTAATQPASGRFRLNNADVSLTTEIYLNATADNLDAQNILASLSAGDRIYIQNSGDASEAILFNISTSTDNTGWFTLTGTVLDAASDTSWSNNAKFGSLIYSAAQSFNEVNDLTAAVVWANVPDANITQSSVTQHQAALSITESQISDLQAYLTSVDISDINATGTPNTTTYLRGDGTWAVPAGGGGGISNVVEDTTPQLGGNLDVNGFDIITEDGSFGSIDIISDGTINFFANFYDNNGSGQINFQLSSTFSDSIYMQKNTGNEEVILAIGAFGSKGLLLLGGDSTDNGAEIRMFNSNNDDTNVDRWTIEANGDLEWSDDSNVVLALKENGTLDNLGATIAEIDSGSNTTLTTKEWVLANAGGGSGATELIELTDVSTATPTNGHALLGNGTTFASRALVEDDISDLQNYALVGANLSTFTNDSGFITSNNTQSKSISIKEPQVEGITLFANTEQITITEIILSRKGTGTVSVDFSYGTDSASTSTIILGTQNISNSTINSVTSFTNATIPANRFINMDITAVGTSTEFNVTIFYTID